MKAGIVDALPEGKNNNAHLDKTLSLELGLPSLDLGVGLGELTKDLVLALDLLLERLSQLLSLMLVVLGLSGEGLTLASLLVDRATGLQKM